MRGIVLLMMLSWLSIPGPLSDVQPDEHQPEILTTDPLVISVPDCPSIEVHILDSDREPVLRWSRDDVPAGLLRPRISTDSLENGVYYFRITCNNDSFLRKMIVKH